MRLQPNQKWAACSGSDRTMHIARICFDSLNPPDYSLGASLVSLDSIRSASLPLNQMRKFFTQHNIFLKNILFLT
jgi:hypothetical protein